MGDDPWRSTTIGAVLAGDGGSVKTGPFGTTLKAREYSREGVPLISVGEVGYGSLRVRDSTPRVPLEVIARLPEYVLQTGDIVFGRKGAVDRSAIVKPAQEGWFLGSDGIRLRLPRTCDARFVAYHLQSSETRSWLLQHATGTTMASLNQSILERLPILLPPLPEQRAIAHILGTLDDKIELNRQMSETLEAIARAIFKSWFVDFDPVRAKAEGRGPGMPKALADLFPDSFEDSELGEIPKGWEVCSLGELVSTTKGRSYRSDELVESDTALVTLKSFARGGGYRPDGLKSFAGTYKPDQVVKPGELVLACTDVTQAAEVIGRPALVRGTDRYRTLVASLDTLILRPRFSGITRTFLYFLGGTEAFVAHTYAHTTGTTVLHLAREAVPSFAFARPPLQVVERFDPMTTPIMSRIQVVEHESGTLATLRDTLLPRLLSGELRVGRAERLVAEAGV